MSTLINKPFDKTVQEILKELFENLNKQGKEKPTSKEFYKSFQKTGSLIRDLLFKSGLITQESDFGALFLSPRDLDSKRVPEDLRDIFNQKSTEKFDPREFKGVEDGLDNYEIDKDYIDKDYIFVIKITGSASDAFLDAYLESFTDLNWKALFFMFQTYSSESRQKNEFYCLETKNPNVTFLFEGHQTKHIKKILPLFLNFLEENIDMFQDTCNEEEDWLRDYSFEKKMFRLISKLTSFEEMVQYPNLLKKVIREDLDGYSIRSFSLNASFGRNSNPQTTLESLLTEEELSFLEAFKASPLWNK